MSKILTIARVFVHQDGEGTFPKWEHGKILSSFKEQTRKFGVTNKGKTYKTVAKCYILNLYEKGRVSAVFLQKMNIAKHEVETLEFQQIFFVSK